jgi:hypothetical protein
MFCRGVPFEVSLHVAAHRCQSGRCCGSVCLCREQRCQATPPDQPDPLLALALQNLQVTIQSVPARDDAPKYQKPDHDLDSIGDLFAELRSCWSPPAADVAHEGMQMSVRFSFKKSGEMIGPPRLTFATSGVPVETRDTYLKAINQSLNACIPLKFTDGLAGALAGRPIAIRYVDNRELGKPAQTP